jgi:membrane carboxypeptidase/penicillin-binding protein
MKLRARIILGLLLAAPALAVAYYGFVAAEHHARTPELFRAAAASVTRPVTRDDLSERQLNALLAIQDPGFYRHGGTDFTGGVMTTISQALSKTLYFDGYRPGRDLLRQSVLARFALDPVIPKDDQLDLFLGSVYLGHVGGRPVRGFAQAAQIHFGKDLEALDDAEFMALLATLAAPNRLGPHADPAANAAQADRIARLAAGECERAGLWHGHRVECPNDRDGRG